MTRYDTVLFDNDGVLVEPPRYETQAEAARTAFRAVGVDDVDQHHVDGVITGVTVEGLSEICTVYDLDEETLWDARERHDERSQLEAFRAGARDCYDDITALSAIRQPCGVVSNNHHSTIEFVLDFFDLGSSFETYYGREMTIESLRLKKPNPHYLDRAVSDLGGESVLYVGDSETDVLAAHRAGADSVFVRRDHSRDVDLSVAPTYEVETLHAVAELASG